MLASRQAISTCDFPQTGSLQWSPFFRSANQKAQSSFEHRHRPIQPSFTKHSCMCPRVYCNWFDATSSLTVRVEFGHSDKNTKYRLYLYRDIPDTVNLRFIEESIASHTLVLGLKVRNSDKMAGTPSEKGKQSQQQHSKLANLPTNSPIRETSHKVILLSSC